MTDHRDVPHGTDPEPCWYCSGTGEDQRRPCPCCQHNEHHAAHPGGSAFQETGMSNRIPTAKAVPAASYETSETRGKLPAVPGIVLRTVITSTPRPGPVAAQPAVPGGWKLAPVEPTREMLDAAHTNFRRDVEIDPLLKTSYRAMLAAAPEAPEPVLDHPASIGGATFGAGIPMRTLVAAAQRRYEVEQTPASQAERQALIDALRRPVVDAELTTLREQNAALEQDAARYHALRAELIRAAGPVDEHGEIEKAIKEVMRKAYAERGDPMPTAAEFDTAIDISIASAEGSAA